MSVCVFACVCVDSRSFVQVEAALSALERGVSVVVIFSGFEPLGVLRILQASYIYPYIYIERERERCILSSSFLGI